MYSLDYTYGPTEPNYALLREQLSRELAGLIDINRVERDDSFIVRVVCDDSVDPVTASDLVKAILVAHDPHSLSVAEQAEQMRLTLIDAVEYQAVTVATSHPDMDVVALANSVAALVAVLRGGTAPLDSEAAASVKERYDEAQAGGILVKP